MLYKSTLRLLLVETDTKQLLVPIVDTSYKKTMWLLHHREPSAHAIGIIEGPINEMTFLQVGEVDIPTVHSKVMRATNVLYISLGGALDIPGVFVLDYSMELEDFIKTYSNVFTPDELLVVLGIGHNKLFRTVGKLVASGEITYVPQNGPNKWSFYDYYWLTEKYKLTKVAELDIRPFINRSGLQIKFRAHAVGLSKKQHANKKLVAQDAVTINKGHDISDDKNSMVLSAVERDYMLSQINDVVASCVAHQ